MPYPPSFNELWDITFPPDTQLANQLGADIRNAKNDIMQRLALLSGTFANRPTLDTVNAVWGGVGFGILYFATDINQVFQWNGAGWTDVSVGVGSLPKLVNKVDIVGQNSNIVGTLYAIPVGQGGMYRVSAYCVVTTAAATSSSLPEVAINWTDNDTNVVTNNTIQAQNGTNNTVGTTNSYWSIVSQTESYVAFNARAGTNISFSTLLYNSNPANAMQYAFHARVEYLG